MGGVRLRLILLCIFLAYYRNYRTMEDIANEYEISVSTTYDIIKLVEKTLCSCKEFKQSELPLSEHTCVIADIRLSGYQKDS